MPDPNPRYRIQKENTGLDESNVDPATVTATVEEDEKEGTPLAGYIERFGGFNGVVIDAFDTELPISLEKWRNADPQKTRLRIALRYAPRKS